MVANLNSTVDSTWQSTPQSTTQSTINSTVQHILTKFPSIPRKSICSALGCNRSSTYRTSKLKVKDSEILEKIKLIKISNPWYGLRRLKLCLKLEYGSVVNIKHLRRICRINSIVAKTRIKRPPKRDNNLQDLNSNYPNKIKELFNIQYTHILGKKKLQVTRDEASIKQNLKPNYIWSSDFTYLKYYNQMYYLSTNIDIFTKEITGFHLSTIHNTNIIIDSLNEGISRYGKPTITHSDQGSEYRSQEYQNLLQINNIICSMSAKSSPWENGFQESYYNNLKLELEFDTLPKHLTYAQIYNYIDNQIDYYNNYRIHTAIATTPAKFREEYYQRQDKIQREEKERQAQN